MYARVLSKFARVAHTHTHTKDASDILTPLHSDLEEKRTAHTHTHTTLSVNGESDLL